MERPLVVYSIGQDEWRSWRQLRLMALAESPSAFSSRFADWQDAPESRWRERLQSAENFIAMLAGAPVGMASGLLDEARNAVSLISLWVAPDARARGVGDALIAAVVAWARARGAEHLALEVGEHNRRAQALYRRHGFERIAGEAEPGELCMALCLR